MEKYCYKCNAKQETYIVQKEEEYLVKNKKIISIIANVRKCKVCDTELLDVELDGENLKNLYSKYDKDL